MRHAANDVHYFLDEGLPSVLAVGLKRLGASATAIEPSTPDQEVIRLVGRCGKRGVWVTRDLESRRRFRNLILEQGISVAWIRDNNGPNLKLAFMVLSFIYRYTGRLENAYAPLYFVVRERYIDGVPSAVVSCTTEL